MSARSFLPEAGFALATSVIAAAAATALGFVLPPPVLARTIVAGVAGACVLRAVGHSQRRTGAVTTVAGWLAGTALAWLLAPTFALFVAIEIGLTWLARAVHVCSRTQIAVADLGLTVAGVCLGVWAGSRTGSTLLAVWCPLLALAFATLVPRRRRPAPDSGFAAALATAEQALERMAARRD